VNWFSKILIKRIFSNVSDFQDIQVRQKVGALEGWISAVSNVVLFGIKIVIGIAVNSIALIADAFHTLADSVSSVVIIFSFRLIGKKPDPDHPYGYGRAEYIATLILSMLIVVTGVELVKSSVGRILSPEISSTSVILILIVLGTVMFKELLARLSFDFGELISSDSLKAEALHHRSDVFASLLAVGSMVLANLGFYKWDGILGIGVGLFVVWTGFSIGREAIDSLLGKPPSKELLERVRSIALNVKRVLNVHDLVIHSYGHNRFISLHIEIPEEATQLEAHDIAEEVMAKLEDTMASNVTVHMDPVTTKGEQANKIQSYLEEVIKKEPAIDSYHDFRIVKSGDHNMILVELFVNPITSVEEQKRIKEFISGLLKNQFSSFDTRVYVVVPIH